ncbi:ABC transporter permease [bacterium]|nr:MAG: ABC transporter permease [bacterium]
MKTLSFLLQKEFKQIFRNPTLLRLIIAVPIIQLMILPLAADYEIKNINLAVVDVDKSRYSEELIQKITASGYFVNIGTTTSFDEAFSWIEEDKADLILEIPENFERNLIRENKERLFMAINAINGVKANMGGAYLGQIIQSYNAEVRMEWIPDTKVPPMPTISISSLNWFNPSLNYDFFMVPGILVFLVTMVGTYMTALNIVKEKEVGTIEQINVTPIKKLHFTLAKLIPFLVIGIFVFTLGLFIVARLVYGIVPAGNIGMIYAYLFLYLISVLGVGLLLSNYSQTQQQAMSLAFFFVMIFLLMGGLFTSIDAMPLWAKWIAYLNPVSYFIDFMRLVVMKGSTFADVKHHFMVICGFAVFFNTWAVISYKKTS